MPPSAGACARAHTHTHMHKPVHKPPAQLPARRLCAGPEQIIHHEESGWLRPAYVLIRDEEVHALLLCIRGTQDRNDVFTSLTGVFVRRRGLRLLGRMLLIWLVGSLIWCVPTLPGQVPSAM